MQNRKIIAFGLLAHINDNNIGIKSFNDIFIPIIKSALCRMNLEGVKSGQSIMEIKEHVDKVFALDIPAPLLKLLLTEISNEVENGDENSHFILHKDGGFQMNKFLFADYEEELEEREEEINEVVKVYESYLTSINQDPQNEPSIFEYIDLNRSNLSKFFAYKYDQAIETEYINQANFINSIKTNKRIYEILRRVYLGSIIAAYLEVEIGEVKNKTELLLDTNFILGLLDLNSTEATHTCGKISEICDRLGFTKSILPFTLEEIESLIERKANQLENAFFQGYLDPESIYNAAKRRNLSKTQLLQIVKNLKAILVKEHRVNLVGNDDKLRNLAKFQYNDIYEFYKNLRGDVGYSALHDTTAIVYVKEKRGKPVKGDIMKANCWFVTNTPFKLAIPENNGYLPEIIRAEDILNFLWLSNPNVTEFINSAELSNLGLTRLVSTTISYALPSPKVLRDLDENFNTYGGTEITADDTVMVASMIASKKIIKPEDLNREARQNSDNFIFKVKEFAEKGRKEEREMKEKLDRVLQHLEQTSTKKETVNQTSINDAVVVSPLEIRLQKLNVRLKIALVFVVLLLFSTFWWIFEPLFDIQQYKNFYLIKILVQILLIALTFLVFNKQYRAAWITGSIAIIAALINCIKT